MDEERVIKLANELLAALTANSANGKVKVAFNSTARGFQFELFVSTVELVDVTPTSPNRRLPYE